MRFTLPLLTLLIMVALTTLVFADERSEHDFSVTSDAHIIQVFELDQPVLTYQKSTKSLDGRWPRANYVHPLYDLAGNIITEDFPEDHGHHRGVFWAWHQVCVRDRHMGDSWACKEFDWDVRATSSTVTRDRVTLKADVLWKSAALVDDKGEQIPIVNEMTTITIFPKQSDHRLINFEIKLQPLLDEVRIGGSDDEKGYGGFSPRLKLTEGTKFFGRLGQVEPKVTGVNVGPWIDVVDETSGVTILSHPDNPGYPEPWVLRQARSMQNAAWPGRELVTLSKLQPTTLRYRLVIHQGSVDRESIDAWQSDFATSE